MASSLHVDNLLPQGCGSLTLCFAPAGANAVPNDVHTILRITDTAAITKAAETEDGESRPRKIFFRKEKKNGFRCHNTNSPILDK
jgi:hypothetical protein